MVVVDLTLDDHPINNHISCDRDMTNEKSVATDTEQLRTSFLGVGTIVLRTASDFEPIQCWQEINQLPELPDTLTTHLEKLLSQKRVRLFAGLPSRSCIRLYLMPNDTNHRGIQHDRKVDAHLFAVLQHVDTSLDAWSGRPTVQQPFDLQATPEDGSLYYIFNSMPSPNPTPENLKSPFHQEALADLLDSQDELLGLRTTLYPYQRRSAGQMLQRECEDKLELDPRLEERIALDGSVYYYAPWDVAFFRSPRFFESCRGGILAETMGLGKTVICIALILATRGHLPSTPAQYYQELTRPTVATLTQMAVSAINRHSAPWRTFFDRQEKYYGEYVGHCVDLMRQHPPSYEIPVEPFRWSRTSTNPEPRRLTLAATTLVVVPRNLLSQWSSELEKHTQPGFLKTLIMDDSKAQLPPSEELIGYDVILFSRPRFEHENRDGADGQGRRISRYPVSCTCPYIGASRTRDCTCVSLDDLYSSPLKSLHFLRIIIDEGHGMAAENTRIASVASNLVEASHRWVVSGTPAKDLLGVEMDLAGPVSHTASPSPSNTDDRDSQYGSNCSASDAELVRRTAILNQRRAFNVKDEKDGAIRSLGSIVSKFLKIRPWTSGDGERAAEWTDHVFRHEMTRLRTRTFSGFSRCLRKTLESIVIKTQPADVTKDIELPPLSHEIVRLEPSFYDKLTVNAFVFVLTANAITSERTDVDYIFHKNSGKERSQLLTNLRASAFYWTGFSAADMEAAIEQSQKYLEKPDKQCSAQDEELLKRCIKQAQIMISSKGWRSLTKSHEVGLFLDSWPDDSAQFWSFNETEPDTPLLCGATQLLQAQDYVNTAASRHEDPAEGLPGTGLRALAVLRSQVRTSPPVKAGIPPSSLASPIRKDPSSSRSKRNEPDMKWPDQLPVEDVMLPSESPLSRTGIIGTTSAKLSYLLSRIEEFYRNEKILVFYDTDNTAWYIAQALEVLHIDYLIYAKSLSPALKSDYVVRFNRSPKHRVLLMDIGQAAYGLNFPCASRVFFVNPVNRPSEEAQALKRAHRIGQTREVFAETLVLKGTIEEKIFERARTMSRSEHKQAKELDDDGGIRHIIQSAWTLPVSHEDAKGYGAVSYFNRREQQQFFARPGWVSWKESAHENSKNRSTVRTAEENHRKGNEATPTKSHKKGIKRARSASIGVSATSKRIKTNAKTP